MGDINFVMRHMDGWKMRSKLAAQFAVGAMAAKTYARCKDLISETDHSLADLAAMGHPYARRHPNNPHDPPETIHTQSGDHLASLRMTKPIGSAKGVSAKVVNDDPVDVWLQIGTSKMIARPYMERVRRDHGREIADAGATEFAKRMGVAGSRRSA